MPTEQWYSLLRLVSRKATFCSPSSGLTGSPHGTAQQSQPVSL